MADTAAPGADALSAPPAAKRLCGWPGVGAGVLSVVETRIKVRIVEGCALLGERAQACL